MKVLILFFLFLSNIYAIDCGKHPIYCRMKELAPSRDSKELMELSNLFYRYAKKYNQDPLLSIAIAMQESGLRNINRKQNIIVYNETCDENDYCTETYEVVRGYTDISMFQFHVNTIKHYKVDPVRLKNDLEYSVEWHFKILKEKRRICKDLGEDAWVCYHSRNKNLASFYKKMVMRYYPTEKEEVDKDDTEQRD